LRYRRCKQGIAPRPPDVLTTSNGYTALPHAACSPSENDPAVAALVAEPEGRDEQKLFNPLARNSEMIARYRELLAPTGIRYVIYGHIGDAHVHVNMLPATPAQAENSQHLLHEFAQESVLRGGTVGAEHGLGKRKRDLLHLQFSASDLEAMKAVKSRLDPRWLLGQGNLFPCETFSS
jgi:FAD/FMN-containing dehydrogenase